MQQIDFRDQAAIVTGAGGGLGRSIAVELARRGASVLVNNRTFSKAEAVVKEIADAGGQALADGTLVGTPQAARTITEKALKAFGRVDIMVNNAGDSAPYPLDEIPDEEVERILSDMTGAYAMMRAVWPVMKHQQYGRILNMASNAVLGIGHNAAYAAAKGGIMGLTNDAAIEGKPLGIGVNTLWPKGYSNLIERIPVEDIKLWFRLNFPPEKVAAVATYLVSRECELTGMTFNGGGGRMARIAFFSSAAYFNPDITPELVAEHISQICDMTGSDILESTAQEQQSYLKVIPWVKEGDMARIKAVSEAD